MNAFTRRAYVELLPIVSTGLGATSVSAKKVLPATENNATVKIFEPICKYSFNRNSTDIDECAPSHPIRVCDGHADCTNTPGSFICQCQQGWNQLINYMEPSGLPGTCGSIVY